MALVISLGGSTINGKGDVDLNFVKRFAKAVGGVKGKVGIVTGGGRVAREYASALAKLGGSGFSADSVAVRATRMNAQVVREALGKEAYPKIPEGFEEAAAALGELQVCGDGGDNPRDNNGYRFCAACRGDGRRKAREHKQRGRGL